MKRRGNLFTNLVLLFTLVPLVELYLLFRIADMTSWLTTFGLVIFTGVTGAHLAKTEGREILKSIRFELEDGKIPGEDLLNGLCVLIGGVLLLTPGILTDFVGFTLLIPSTRDRYKDYFKKKFNEMIKRGTIHIFFR